MLLVRGLAAASLLLLVDSADAAFYSKKSAVIQLDSKNFKSEILDSKHVSVNTPVCFTRSSAPFSLLVLCRSSSEPPPPLPLPPPRCLSHFQCIPAQPNSIRSLLIEWYRFYAPWCGHCQNLKPAYDKVASSLKGIVKVAAIDCDDEKNKRTCGEYGVQGFPTLKIFSPSNRKGKPSIEGTVYSHLTTEAVKLTHIRAQTTAASATQRAFPAPSSRGCPTTSRSCPTPPWTTSWP